MFLFCLSQLALGGSVFVNGVNVDALRDQTFENVTVYIDAQGDVQVKAPGYAIEVVQPEAPASGPPEQLPERQIEAPIPPPASASTAAVPANRWWLVTEDNASTGHAVTVYLNDTKVKTVRSGQAQLIDDIGAWLKLGANSVRVESESAAPTGGTFYIYLGSGGVESGTVVMDPPQVQFGVGRSRDGAYQRSYTLNVTE